MPRQKNILGPLMLRRENLGGFILSLVVAAIIGLIIYNFVSGPKNQTGTETEKSQEQQQTEEGKVTLPTSHTVTRGEHLSKISQKYYNRGDLWPALVKTNNITNPSVIEPNTKLTIPKLEEAQTVKLSDIVKRQTGEIKGEAYTVQKGDSLWDIAQRSYGNGFLWTKIDQANKLSRLPNGRPLIHNGNILIIPR